MASAVHYEIPRDAGHAETLTNGSSDGPLWCRSAPFPLDASRTSVPTPLRRMLNRWMSSIVFDQYQNQWQRTERNTKTKKIRQNTWCSETAKTHPVMRFYYWNGNAHFKVAQCASAPIILIFYTECSSSQLYEENFIRKSGARLTANLFYLRPTKERTADRAEKTLTQMYCKQWGSTPEGDKVEMDD
ncbi:hypothetical protein WN51_06701 [Melipona quadrifasciata]|uniref:Uncharacterized protein n=1 Tax=Melipona quadrifasciata TaxID=166423 RepID=A0A0N0BKC9_9HYME|nr:hypothetical protein WN51_06701 [Melipona quadrifasciata]